MELLNIADFRKQFESAIQGKPISTFDRRDITRIRNNDKYVLCFINWKKGCIDAAVSLAVEVLKWRKEMKVNDIGIDNLDGQLLRRGIVFVHGRALDSTRIVYFNVRLQTKSIKTTVQQILCLWLEKLHQQETGNHITFVLDVSKATMSNVDLGSIKFLLDCFTIHFPDLLERLIVLEMPWIMNAIWKIVKQWMSEEERRRIAFCNFKELKQYISPKNMLTSMGGMDDWSYKFPPPVDEFPALDTSSDVCYLAEPNGEQQDNDSETYSSMAEEDEEVDGCSQESEEENSLTDAGKSQDRNSPSGDDSIHVLNSIKQRQRSMVELRRHPEEPKKVHLSSPDMGLLQLKQKSDSFQRNGYNFLNGVNLNSLLILSPASEVLFRKGSYDETSCKFESRFTLTNLNRENQVAFKIKSNCPPHYLVKPNTGFVSPGDTVTIFLYLNAGFETVVPNDKFLILYQRKGDATSVKEFWRTHMPKHMRYEYRLKVRFTEKEQRRKTRYAFHERLAEHRKMNAPNVFPPPPPSSQPQEACVQDQSQDELSSFTESSIPDVDNLSMLQATTNGRLESELECLTDEISSLKKSIASMETSSEQMRIKLRYCLGLNCFVVFLLLFLALKLSVLTSLLELGHSWQ